MATSPEGTAEGWGVGLDLSRPFGTRDLLASNPALKRWAYSRLSLRDRKAAVFPVQTCSPVAQRRIGTYVGCYEVQVQSLRSRTSSCADCRRGFRHEHCHSRSE